VLISFLSGTTDRGQKQSASLRRFLGCAVCLGQIWGKTVSRISPQPVRRQFRFYKAKPFYNVSNEQFGSFLKDSFLVSGPRGRKFKSCHPDFCRRQK
jgi:hypothetical protein